LIISGSQTMSAHIKRIGSSISSLFRFLVKSLPFPIYLRIGFICYQNPWNTKTQFHHLQFEDASKPDTCERIHDLIQNLNRYCISSDLFGAINFAYQAMEWHWNRTNVVLHIADDVPWVLGPDFTFFRSFLQKDVHFFLVETSQVTRSISKEMAQDARSLRKDSFFATIPTTNVDVLKLANIAINRALEVRITHDFQSHN